MSRLFKHFGVTVQKGAPLFQDGEKAETLYLIHRGKVKISKFMGGAEQDIQILGEGEFVGEMAIINDEPRSATAVALDDCELIKMDRPSFEETVRKNNKFAVSFIEFLSNRLRQTNEILSNLTERNRKNEFLIKIFCEFAGSGKRDSRGKWILLRLDSVMEKFENMGISTAAFSGILHDVITDGTLTLKRDKNSTTWIACDHQSIFSK